MMTNTDWNKHGPCCARFLFELVRFSNKQRVRGGQGWEMIVDRSYLFAKTERRDEGDDVHARDSDVVVAAVGVELDGR